MSRTTPRPIVRLPLLALVGAALSSALLLVACDSTNTGRPKSTKTESHKTEVHKSPAKWGAVR